MTPEDLGRSLGRLEAMVEGIDKKLDDAVTPAVKAAHRRLDRIERTLWIATGIGITSGAGLAMARELILSWLKHKLGYTA